MLTSYSTTRRSGGAKGSQAFSILALLVLAAGAALNVRAGEVARFDFGGDTGQAYSTLPTSKDANLIVTAPANGFGNTLVNPPATGAATFPDLAISTSTVSATLATAVTNNSYAEFVFIPKTGFALNCSSFTFKGWRGGASTPRGVGVRSSIDNFVADLLPAPGNFDLPTDRTGSTAVTADLSGASFQNLTAALRIRIYGYAPANGSTVEVDNVVLNGTVTGATPVGFQIQADTRFTQVASTLVGNTNAFAAHGGFSPSYWQNPQAATLTTAQLQSAGFVFPLANTGGILIATINGEGGTTGIAAAGVTWGGTPMTAVNAGATNGNCFSFMYYLLNPSGSGPLVFNLSNAPTRYGIGAVYATGAAQLPPESNSLNIGQASPITLPSINVSTGSLVVDCIGDQNTPFLPVPPATNGAGITLAGGATGAAEIQLYNMPNAGSGGTASYRLITAGGTAGATWTNSTAGSANETGVMASFLAFNPIATPTANPPGGTFTTSVAVSLSDATPGSVIRFTTDGSTPTAASTVYTAPLLFAATTTLKAVAFVSPSPNPSFVMTQTYTKASTTVTAENVISVNFPGRDNTAAGNPPVTSMAAAEIAGVVPRGNWNNALVNNASTPFGTTATAPFSIAVNNQNATPSGTVTWGSSDAWSTTTPDVAGNQRMMRGYINMQNGGPPGQYLTVTFSGLPASFAGAPYDVYVYAGTDAGNQDGDVTLTDASHVYTIRGTTRANPSFSTNTFDKQNGGTNATPVGNYWWFTNVIGTSFNLSGAVANGATRLGFTGIQVVQTIKTHTPVALSGWNADVVLENAATPVATAFDNAPGTATWFEARTPNPADGFPQGGLFTSENDLSTQYQLQSYTANNCLRLAASASGTLTLSSAIGLTEIRILAASSNGTATTTGTFVLNYTDSTSSAPISFNAFDWGNAAPTNAALKSLGRSSTSASFTYDRPVAFNLYETQAVNPAPAKNVASITFTAPAGVGAAGIFAVSATQVSNNSITSVSPNSGPTAGGQTGIVISGTGIQAGATVKFGTQTVPAANTVVNVGAQTITVTSPPSAPAGSSGVVNVSYTNPDTTGATLVNGYLYTDGTVPTITSVVNAPANTVPGTGRFDQTTNITINGTGFSPNIGAGSVVINDGAAHTVNANNVVFVSPTRLTATVPVKPANFVSNVVNVVVINPDNQTATLTGGFNYIPLPLFSPFNAQVVGTGTGTATTPLTYYNGSQIVTITPSPASATGVSIYYTLDGSTPVFPVAGTTQTYTAPFTITAPALPSVAQTTVKAIEVINGVNGPVQTSVYAPYFPATATPATSISTGSMNYLYNATNALPPFNTGSAVTASGIVQATAPDVLTNFTDARAANTFAPGTTPLAAGLLGQGTLLNGRPLATGNSGNQNGLNATAFQTRFTGIFIAPTTGVYTLTTGSDDGSQLYIDPISLTAPDAAHLIVANNAGQGVTRRSGQIGLVAGQHSIVVDYANTGGGFGLELLWDPLGGNALVNIPNANLAVSIPVITWVGGGTTGDWSQAANWTPRVPQNGDAVILTGAGAQRPTNMNIANLNLFSLTFDATTTTAVTVADTSAGTTGLGFSGGPTGLLTVDTAAANHTLSTGVRLVSPLTVAAGANRTVAFSGVVSGGGGLIFNGAGTATLTNAGNSYTGTTTITAGTLSVALISNGGANGFLGASAAASANLILNGGTLVYTGAASTTDRGMTVSGNSNLDVATGPLTINGVITGGSRLTKTGAGQVVLTAVNTSTGGITVSAGEILAKANNALGTGSAIVNNAADIRIDNSANFTLANPFTLNSTNATGAIISNGGTQTLGGAITLSQNSTIAINANSTIALGKITGTGIALKKSGAGELILASPTSSYGNTDVNAGKLTATAGASTVIGATAGSSLGLGTVTLSGGILGVSSPPTTTVTGFGGTGTGWTLNGGLTAASFPSPDVLQITDAVGNQARSAWFNTKVPVDTFTATFNYLCNTAAPADGLTFTLQNSAGGLNAIGGAGGALAYNGGNLTTNSVAFQLNCFGTSSMGVGTNGALSKGDPTAPVNINTSLHQIAVNLTYNGAVLIVTLTDATAATTITRQYPIDIPTVLGSGIATLGFTGATGGQFAVQQISNFTYSTSISARPSAFVNNVAVTAVPSTIEVGVPFASFNSLTVTPAGTVSVVPAASRPNAAYSLIFNQAATINANTTLDVANNGAGFTGTLSVFGISSPGAQSLTKAGAGTLQVTAPSTYGGATSISAGLVQLAAPVAHRWSFNGNLNDSVGGSNAMVVVGTLGASSTLGATDILLNGGTNGQTAPGVNARDYVSLGTGLVPKSATSGTGFTMELWGTLVTVQNWGRIFDINTENVGGNSNNFLMMSWTQGTNLATDQVEFQQPAGTTTLANTNQPYSLNQEFHIALVVTPGGGAGGPTGATPTLVQWYTNTVTTTGGVGAFTLKGSFSTARQLATLPDTNMWLGASPFPGDSVANARYNEVRMWNTALSLAQLNANHTAGPNAIPVTGSLPATTAVTISNGATLDLNGASQTIASLAGVTGSAVTLGGGALTAGDATSTSFGGVISGGAGTLTKEGTGTLSLAGANTYTGTTTVNAGSLAVNGSLTSAVTVNANGTLRGTGTVLATTTVGTGVLWPGTSLSGNGVVTTTEKLTLASLTPAAGMKLKIAANNTNAQQLVVSGGPAFSLSGDTLSLGLTTATYSNKQYIVLDATNGTNDFITGGFSTVTVNGAAPGAVTVDYLDHNNVANASIAALPGAAANRVRITINGAVTPVTIDSLAAKAEGAGALVEWSCVSEFQNAGFNVYRRSVGADDWTRVNSGLIAGRITSPDFKKYSLYDWAQSGLYEYKLESVSIGGIHEPYAKLAGPVTVDAQDAAVTVNGCKAALASVVLAGETERGNRLSAKFAEAAPSAQDGLAAFDNVQPRAATLAFDAHGKLALPAVSVRALSSNDSLNAVAQVGMSTTGTADVGSRAVNIPGAGMTAGVRWFTGNTGRTAAYTSAKAVYSAPGVLLIPQNMLPPGFNANRVSITREGRTMPALAVTANGLVVFGPGYQDEYTDKDAIFLRNTSAPTSAGKALHATGLFTGAQSANVDSATSVTTDYHDVYFDFSYRPFTFAPWFSSKYLTDGTTQNFSLSTPGAGGGTASLTVNLWSLTHTEGVSPDHALQLIVNGHPAGQAVWSGGNAMMQLTFQIASGVLNNGANQIDLVTPALSGVSSQISFLHSMSVSYTQALDGSKPVDVYNLSARPKLFEVSRVPNSGAWVVDARYPDRAALVAYESQAQADGTYTLRFQAATGGTGHYLVVPVGQENLPVAVNKRQVKALKAETYIATGPAQFGTAVQPLLKQRSKEGIRGSFVDQEQIFDYYNYGRYGPAGIQNAVRSVRPQYLLLLGRTTYDYRNYTGLGVDPLCPTFLVSTTFWAEATSDSKFGDLGRGYPEIAVGRLPVNDAHELGRAVAHVLGNTGLATGYRVHAVADRADPEAGDFANEADGIAQAHPDLAWQPNYLGVTHQTSPEVTAAMTEAANGGADLLIYIGHGNAARLGNEVPRILDNDKVAAWTGNKVFVQSTCTANWMAKNEAGYQSIAIQALTQPQGGISASIGSSTYMNSQHATEFASQLLTQAGMSQRWGNALLKAQQWAYAKGDGFYSDLSSSEQIFGDPAMPVMSKGAASQTPKGGATAPATTPVSPGSSVVPGQF